MIKHRKSVRPLTAPPVAASPQPPAIPAKPQTEQERLDSEALSRELRELAQMMKQRNLDSAVALAREAAAGRGVLVEHFAELGRRFGRSSVNTPDLRTIDGGAA